MDQAEEPRKMLDAIVKKGPKALNDADKRYMIARKAYLSRKEKEVFAEALTPTKSK